MPYQLKDPSIVSELHPGDMITADVLLSKSGQQTVLLDHIVVVAQSKPDYKPAVNYHVPAAGETSPISDCATRTATRYTWRSSKAKRCW